MVTIPGDRLRAALAEAGMSQAQLARLLPASDTQVSAWVKGHRPLAGANALRVAELLRRNGARVELTDGWRLFFASPMAALDDGQYETDRAVAEPVYERLRALAGPTYWAPSGIARPDRFEAPDLAAVRWGAALRECEALVYLQLHELTRPTSAHVEVGMALARAVPVTVFAPSEKLLPFTLRGYEAVAGQVFGGRYRFYETADAAAVLRLLSIHGAELLGLDARVAA